MNKSCVFITREKNQMFVVDAREIAPIASTPEMFHSGNQSIPLPGVCQNMLFFVFIKLFFYFILK